MNEELQKALAEIINGALSSASAAKDFVLAELPDVVRQLLMWKAAEAAIYCLLGVVLLLCAAWLIVRVAPARRLAIQGAEEDRKAGERWTKFQGTSYGVTSLAYDTVMVTGGVRPTIFAVMAFISALIGIDWVNLTWLQIWLAPKVYLLEYAANLVGGK